MMRRAHLPSAQNLEICIEDILGPPPDPKSVPDLWAALRELETKIGLRSVKEAVQLLVMLAQVNYERQLKGEPPQLIPLNRLFLGNPGTGKTTVAKVTALAPHLHSTHLDQVLRSHSKWSHQYYHACVLLCADLRPRSQGPRLLVRWLDRSPYPFRPDWRRRRLD